MNLQQMSIKRFVYQRGNYNKIAVRLKKMLFRPMPNDRCLNIGGGNWYLPRWQNIDLYANSIYVDCKMDLRSRTRIPLGDDSVRLVFTSHFLEHISDEECMFLLSECHRLLRQGGTIRISVPDMEKAFNAYFAGDHAFFDKGGTRCVGDTLERKFVNFFSSYRKGAYSGGPLVSASLVQAKVKELDRYSFCAWCADQIPIDADYRGHVNAYDFEKLQRLLKTAGFFKVTRSEYRQSSVEEMRSAAFDNRQRVSLFVEANK
jgi:hypothetical protein